MWNAMVAKATERDERIVDTVTRFHAAENWLVSCEPKDREPSKENPAYSPPALAAWREARKAMKRAGYA